MHRGTRIAPKGPNSTARLGAARLARRYGHFPRGDRTGSIEIHPPTCICEPGKKQTFVYYEAWRVGLNARGRVTNPPGTRKTPFDDTASWEPDVKGRGRLGTCREYMQQGDLRFYSESVTGDLSTNSCWRPDPTRFFGNDTRCRTTAWKLHAFDSLSCDAADEEAKQVQRDRF